jgi:hypothetical protein
MGLITVNINRDHLWFVLSDHCWQSLRSVAGDWRHLRIECIIIFIFLGSTTLLRYISRLFWLDPKSQPTLGDSLPKNMIFSCSVNILHFSQRKQQVKISNPISPVGSKNIMCLMIDSTHFMIESPIVQIPMRLVNIPSLDNVDTCIYIYIQYMLYIYFIYTHTWPDLTWPGMTLPHDFGAKGRGVPSPRRRSP